MRSLSNDTIIEKFDSPIYQLLEKIGKGGFGYVYRAKQINTEQIVAIKFLTIDPDFDAIKKARYTASFERETLLVSRLQHPNIVRLLDKGSCADLLFAVFEYVDGKTLKDILAESGGLSAVKTVDIMGQVLEALAHAHQQGIIHRDIKPSNIMLSKTGTKTHVKVLDFGIGTLINEVHLFDDKYTTLNQEICSTPSYCAPEQLRGEPPTLKTDIYVWGLLFIECITGHAVMAGSTIASVFHKQLSQTKVPLPTSIIGHPIAALLRRVLQKKTNERTGNAQQLYSDLISIQCSNISVTDVATKIDKSSPAQTPLMTVFDQTLIRGQAIHRVGLTERKQITALSLNFSAHAVDGAIVDDELLDALMRDQKNQCMDIAIRYGAHHVGALADSILFYFGYPVVNDNDSRLCARSALDIISRLHKRNALLKASQKVELSIRIGINTGLVTCYAETTPEGNTVNIAMQLARLAEQNTIYCSETSKKLLQNYIEFEPVTRSILGFNTKKTPVYSLTSERHVEAFGFLRGIKNKHDFIGRDRELLLLDNLINNRPLDNSKLSKCIHIFGESGIGKSRLLYELRNKTNVTAHYVAQCLPEYSNNALYPILNILKGKYSLDLLTPEHAIAKLRTVLQKSNMIFDDAGEPETISILCAWLDLTLPKDLTVSIVNPQRQKQILFKAITTLLMYEDNQGLPQPIIFVLEDMHWADPSSIEFIENLIRDSRFIIEDHLFISTSRLVLPPLLNDLGFELIKLDRLTRSQTGEFIRFLFAKENVSKNLLDIIVARTEGIPLFIEELVAMLKQNGIVHKLNGIFDFTSPEKQNYVPSNLRDSLQQKLDSLTYAKETAQQAATIGREFDYKLLIRVSNLSETRLQNDLNELIDSNVIYQQRKINGDSYIFQHTLLRDAAYDSMVSETRTDVHLSVAKSLKIYFPNESKRNSFVIANHYAKAKHYEKAVTLGISSANFALSQSGESYAITHLTESLIWNENIHDINLKNENELAIHSLMIPALMVSKGYGAEEFNNIAKKSNEIFDLYRNKKKSDNYKKYSFNILWGVFLFHNNRSLRTIPFELAQQMLAMALDNNDIQQEIFANVTLGFCDWNDGRYNSAKLILESAVTYYESMEFIGDEFAIRFGLDAKSWALSILSLIYWSMGYSKKSTETIKRAIKWSEKINHLGNLSYTNTCYSILLFQQGNKNEIIQVEKKQTESENKFGAQFIATLMRVPKDWATSSSTYSITFLDQYRENGLRIWATILEAILASMLLEQSEVDAALPRIESIIEWALESGENCFLSKLYLLQAMLQIRTNNGLSKLTDKLFMQSINIAMQQGIYYQALESILQKIDWHRACKSQIIPSEIIETLKIIISKIPSENNSQAVKKATQIINHTYVYYS